MVLLNEMKWDIIEGNILVESNANREEDFVLGARSNSYYLEN